MSTRRDSEKPNVLAMAKNSFYQDKNSELAKVQLNEHGTNTRLFSSNSSGVLSGIKLTRSFHEYSFLIASLFFQIKMNLPRKSREKVPPGPKIIFQEEVGEVAVEDLPEFQQFENRYHHQRVEWPSVQPEHPLTVRRNGKAITGTM